MVGLERPPDENIGVVSNNPRKSKRRKKISEDWFGKFFPHP